MGHSSDWHAVCVNFIYLLYYKYKNVALVFSCGASKIQESSIPYIYSNRRKWNQHCNSQHIFNKKSSFPCASSEEELRIIRVYFETNCFKNLPAAPVSILHLHHLFSNFRFQQQFVVEDSPINNCTLHSIILAHVQQQHCISSARQTIDLIPYILFTRLLYMQ